MKKQLFIFVLFCLSFVGAVQAAQPLQTYVRVGVGCDVGLNGLSVKSEVGLRWWFLDGSLSYILVRSWPGDNYSGNNAFMLNAAVDLIEAFCRDCRHGLSVGAGFGLSRYVEQETDLIAQTNRIDMSMRWYLSLKAAYHYEFKNGFALGAFYEMLPIGANDLSMVGLSVAKTF